MDKEGAPMKYLAMMTALAVAVTTPAHSNEMEGTMQDFLQSNISQWANDSRFSAHAGRKLGRWHYRSICDGRAGPERCGIRTNIGLLARG